MVRTTYVLHESDIKKLKDSVMSNIPGLVYLSSFVAVAAYMWSRFVKSGDLIGVWIKQKRIFLFLCRSTGQNRTPGAWKLLGQLYCSGRFKIGHGVLAGDEGFFVAAEAMTDYIQKLVNNKEKVLKGAENWLSDFKKMESGGTFW